MIISIDSIVELFLYVFILYSCNNFDIFFYLISIDAVISTYIFIKTLLKYHDNFTKNYKYERKSYEKNRSTINNLLHIKNKNDGLFDKYLLFGLISMTCKLYDLISWNSTHKYFCNFMLLCGLSSIRIALLSNNYFNIISNHCKKNLKECFRYTLCKMTAHTINTFSMYYLDNGSNIKYNELTNFYSDFNHSLIISKKIIKRFGLMITFYYFKKYGNSKYYRYIVKVLYKYQIGEPILISKSNKSDEEKKYILNDIIKNHRWKHILKPKNINLIFELYDLNNNDKSVMNNIIELFYMNILRLLNLWSLSSVSPILTIVIDFILTKIYDKFNNNIYFLSYIVSLPILIFNPLIGALMVVFSDFFAKNIINYITEKKIYIYLLNDMELLAWSIMYIFVFNKLNLFVWLNILLYFVYFNAKCVTLSFLIGILGYTSNYNALHTAILWLINIIFINAYDLYIKHKQIQNEKKENDLKELTYDAKEYYMIEPTSYVLSSYSDSDDFDVNDSNDFDDSNKSKQTNDNNEFEIIINSFDF